MKNIIGLTGPTGAGKSVVAAAAKAQGIAVIDCDLLCREVYKNNSLCRAALAEAFGQSVIENNDVNRKNLAAIAFKSKENTEKLNQTVLPFIISGTLEEIEKQTENTVLLDAPTLFESGLDDICTIVIAVLSSLENRKERIIKRDNLSEDAALSRINAGKSDDFYLERANYCLNNNGTVEEITEQFLNILKLVKE